jgi:UDP-glucose 4-epimerase
MKWLITGGCGFIGRSLIAKLISETGHQIRVLDNLSVGSREDLFEICDFTEKSPDECLGWGEAVELIVGDILSDITTLQVCVGADVIVHLAANTGVGPSVDDPMSDCKTNVIGTLNVLEACRSNGINRFVFASSGAPLGVQVPPLHEEMAPHPASPYGASKLAGEGYCSAYYHCFGVNTVVLRFGNVYGEGSKHKASVVAKFIKLAMNGEDLEVYGDGLQTRDFIHISDLVKAIYKAATIPDIGGEKFQIASASETTVTELVDLLLDKLEAEGISRPKVYNGEKRDGDVQRNFSDTSKARDQLNWTADIQLADGLSRTIKFFKNCN